MPLAFLFSPQVDHLLGKPLPGETKVLSEMLKNAYEARQFVSPNEAILIDDCFGRKID
jgi:hypothetical protein